MVGESESSCAFPTLHYSTDCLIHYEEYSAGPHSVFTRNLFKMVHNEIHNIQKPREALPSQAFQVVTKVIKGLGLAKGTFCFQTRPEGTLEAQRAQCPSIEA